jgi:5-formyltetrahydrofolate cyclo-ligase
MMDKTLLRKTLLAKRARIPRALRRLKSRRIFKKISKLPVFKKAHHIACYYGITPEVETKFFLKEILKNKSLYLPKVGPKRSLTLHRVRSLSRDLRKGAYSIMEPKLSHGKKPAGSMDLLIVPGVAFDKRGGRLGRGGGYYDRLLRKARRVPKMGICFREQIVKKVPMTAQDVRVDRVITD